MIVTHRNADPDAVASAVIAYRAAEAAGCRPCIFFPEGVSSAARSVAEAFSVDLASMECSGAPGREDLGGAVVVIVDSSNSTQVGLGEEELRSAGSVVLIDHHEPGDLVEMAKAAVHEPGAATATQLALRVLLAMGGRLSPHESSLALAGIIHDTRRFLRADSEAFASASLLIKWGGDYGRVVSILGRGKRPADMDVSERIARLKAAQRAVIGRFCRDYIVAVTHVGSFESSAARALLELGADVAVVVSSKGEETRVSVRVSRRALEAGVSAAEIARYVAEKLGGKGGGHGEAGMAHVPRKLNAADVAAELAKSLPGKAARLCTERRREGIPGANAEV
ncbi:bifunctional oligoribonuclease/PAP phosphatase NrnA [Stetteria hydrogenophila]